MRKAELVEAFRAFDAKKDAPPLAADTASGMSQAYDDLRLQDLRKLAKTKEMRPKNKLQEGGCSF